MTWAVITVAPDTDIRHAARIMRERKLGALPVADGGRVIGMLTATDLTRAAAQGQRERRRSRGLCAAVCS